MNIDDMTPEQLREYAAEKEARRAALEKRYISDGRADGIEAEEQQKPWEKERRDPWEKPIEVDGVTYWVDMRTAKSERFVKRLSEVQRALKADGGSEVPLMLDLYEFVLGAENGHITEVVTEAEGYDDFVSIYAIKQRIFEQLDLKN